tara:strand:+ start:2271 stop:3548 length:1278 start_codon:yes stop_codon:yes gene_type:complete
MLHPIVINPDFLINAKDNDEILNKFSSFIKSYKEYWKDIFILVDDKNNTLSKKYEEIKYEFGHENYIFNSILDFIISHDKTKKINLNIDISKKKIDDLLQNLKDNKVKKIVTFPEYLKDEKISLKDLTEKKPFSKMTTDQVIDRITSITRFSKNVTLIDPMIPYTICNINSRYHKSHKNDLSKVQNFKKTNTINSDLIFSLNKLIREIYNSNFFRDDLKINIRTTIQNSKIKHFKEKIEDNIRIKRSFESAKNQNHTSFKFYPDPNKNKYDEYNAIEINGELHSLSKEENEKNLKVRRNVMTDDQIRKEIECWINLSEKIKNYIISCTSGIIGSLKPSVVINSHYKDKNKDDDPTQDIYDRHILALDLDYSYEVRKGLDIFDAKKRKLKNITSWYIKLDTGLFEKSAAYYVLTHSLFKPTEIIFN